MNSNTDYKIICICPQTGYILSSDMKTYASSLKEAIFSFNKLEDVKKFVASHEKIAELFVMHDEEAMLSILHENGRLYTVPPLIQLPKDF